MRSLSLLPHSGCRRATRDREVLASALTRGIAGPAGGLTERIKSENRAAALTAAPVSSAAIGAPKRLANRRR
jgi:hypothetical protein